MDITYEEIYKLFIVQNLRSKDIEEKYGNNYLKAIKFYNLKKSKEQRSECRRKTCLEKYGVCNVSQSKNIKQKKMNTVLSNYGVTNPMKSNEVRRHHQNTLLEKYGVDNPAKSEEIKEKTKQTNLEKYGFKNPMQNENVKNNYRKSMLQKYNVDNPQKSEKIHNKTIQTRIEKYGDSRLFGSSSFYEKAKQTCIERYNVDNVMKNSEIKQKIIDNAPNMVKKMTETKRKRKTFNTSKVEEYAYKLLTLKFNEVIRQYKSEEYPFACDFYIPEFALYIELNCHWTHGLEPFDVIKHKAVLEKWKEKSKTSLYYQNAIEVWTRVDVEKLNKFKENNLNYLIFYSKKQFEEWFKTV